MNNHHCQATIITCIDFRFQDYIHKWIAKNAGAGNFDRVAYAGGVKEFETILKQIEISKRLHHINKVVLINHEDCGAYGPELSEDKEAEHNQHDHDLKNVAERIKSQFNDIEVNLYFLHLDGTFETITT